MSWPGTLQGPSTCLMHCFWNYIEIKIPPRTTDANFGCAFVKNTILTNDPKWGPLSDNPDSERILAA